MGQSYFVWNGVDCRSMGVSLAGPAPIVRPEERVSHVTIPGRSGDLTKTEGNDVYNSYIQTVTIQVRGGARVRDVYKWLRGAGYVTFSGEPDRRQKARIIGAITLDRHSRNLDIYVGEVQFYCQPLKELLHPEKVTVTTSGTTVNNGGDVTAKPMWKVTASSTSFTLSCGGNTLSVTNITSGNNYYIDAETMELLGNSQNNAYTQKTTGEFPVLPVGDNSVTFTNLSAVEIEKRERYL